MRLLALFWLAGCSGDGVDTTDTGTGTEPTVDSGPTSTGDTSTLPTCSPSVELGTGELAFESLDGTIDMIHGPQGGWHVVTAVRLCDLGDSATVSFLATRVDDDLAVGGSGTVQRLLLPDGPCCHVAVDVFTYLLVPGYDVPPDALHDQAVRLDVDVTLPDDTVWTDSTEIVFIDSTL